MTAYDGLVGAVFAERVPAVEKLRAVVILFDSLYFGNIVGCKHIPAVAHIIDSIFLKLGRRHCKTLVDEAAYSRLHRLHAFRFKLGARRRERPRQHLGVVAVEHCAVGYAASRQVVESVARHLAAANHNVVATVGRGFQPEAAQHRGHGGGVLGKGAAYLVAGHYVGKHEVIHIGVHTATAATPAHHVDATAAAIVHIHLLGHILMPPAYHSGAHTPRKEIAVGRKARSHPLLHREIEG